MGLRPVPQVEEEKRRKKEEAARRKQELEVPRIGGRGSPRPTRVPPPRALLSASQDLAGHPVCLRPPAVPQGGRDA